MSEKINFLKNSQKINLPVTAACAAVFFLVFLIFLNFSQKNEIRLYEAETFAMGTVINIKIYAQKDYTGEVIALITSLENSLSAKLPSSGLNSIGEGWTVIDEPLYECLEIALDVARASGGAFDPTIGALTALWDVRAGQKKIPSKEGIGAARERVFYNGLEISADSGVFRAKILSVGQILDLGGVAKGYIADRAAEFLRGAGVKSGLLDFGGNIIAIGGRPDSEGWNIGIQEPKKVRGETIYVLEIADGTVVTSGNYERYFELWGKRYHHIIDAATGYPADAGLDSVTVWGEGSSAVADALSTAIFVLGYDEGIKLLEHYPQFEAIFITKNQKILHTKNAPEYRGSDRGTGDASPVGGVGAAPPMALIKQNGKVISNLNITKEATYTIKSDNKYNTITSKNSSIAITDANCPDKLCVKTGAIKNTGQAIICLPHRLSIRIEN